MRLFVCGSAPLPVQILEEFRALFGHTILERYGMTETLMNMSIPTRASADRVASACRCPASRGENLADGETGGG